MMRRYFNTEGQCEPHRHYMVRIDDRLKEIKERYVDRGSYFVINRGRQYGKTTTLMALSDYLKSDYAGICNLLKQDSLVASTIDEYYGIRILNQDPWEALVSFVISQQNNIKRIKGIIQRLCDTYGEEICAGWHAFPSAQTLSGLDTAAFEALGMGYRAKYVKKLADDVASGAINLDEIKKMSLEDAKQALLDIYGVGIKVANCALLFGFQFVECFPVDVWIKRVLEYYPNGLPDCFKGYEGIAQQYLFHWARNNLK